MKAKWGDTIEVCYNLWVDQEQRRTNETMTLILRPGPTPGPLVHALLGLRLQETRFAYLPNWVVWERRERPDDIPPDCEVAFEMTLVSIQPAPEEATRLTGGSVADRIRRVDPTLAERYRQRAGQ
jgi:hypothetical protein